MASVVVGIGVSIAVFEDMSHAGHGRWVSPVDALLCPVAGFTTGMMDRRHGGPSPLFEGRP